MPEIGWIEALRRWNAGSPSWCIPKKGSAGYDAVMRIRKGEAPAASVKDRAKEMDKKIKKSMTISLDDDAAPSVVVPVMKKKKAEPKPKVEKKKAEPKAPKEKKKTKKQEKKEEQEKKQMGNMQAFQHDQTEYNAKLAAFIKKHGPIA